MPRLNTEIDRLIEKQLRNWEIARTQRRKVVGEGAAPLDVAEFVTVSRMVGSGGSAVGRRLGERLGWPVFDKTLLQHMAGDDSVRGRLYEVMDERDIGWVERVLHYLCGEKYEPDDYFRTLASTVLAIARGGNAVFLGRAADLLLPADHGLRVRIIAPQDRCVENYAQREGLERDAARKEIDRIVKERAGFIRRYFDRDAADPSRHDLVINLARLTEDDAIDLIVRALRRRGVAAAADN